MLKKSAAVLFILTSTLLSPTASATTFEAEVNLFQGKSALLGHYGPGIRGGLALGNHVVLLTGLDLSLTGGESEHSTLSMEIPLEVKVYLRRPGAGKVVPDLRLGAGYGYNRWSLNENPDVTTHWITGSFTGGLQYFFSEHFAVSASAGLGIRKTVNTTETSYLHGVGSLAVGGVGSLAGSSYYDRWEFGVEGRLGLILRI